MDNMLCNVAKVTAKKLCNKYGTNLKLSNFKYTITCRNNASI